MMGIFTSITLTPISIKRDGIPYSNWILQNNNTVLKISTSLNDHAFEIVTAALALPRLRTSLETYFRDAPLSEFTDSSTGTGLSAWNGILTTMRSVTALPQYIVQPIP